MEESWSWTKKKELAAMLLAESLFSYVEIVAKVKISDTALRKWRRTPEFKERVDALSVEFKERVRSEGIAILENRVAGLNDRWQRMQKVILARGKDPQMQDVPGGDTGLLLHKIKSIGGGEFATTVDEYEVDCGLLKEMRGHEEQAARELGQWTEKSDLSSGGGPLIIQFASIPTPPWAEGFGKP